MTQLERLQRKEAETKAALEAALLAHKQSQANTQAEELKLLNKRRFEVGTDVDHAGLFALDNAVLRQLFALLTPLTQVPNPVAVLEGCLAPQPVRVPTNGTKRSPAEPAAVVEAEEG